MYTDQQRQHDLILGKLAQIEVDHGVEIICAVESGSRAWGFPSPDSDYDVRFVYRQQPRDYMRLLKRPDTLGRPVKGALYDVTGWDVAKALTLALKSNATLLEWLASPIRYRWSAEADDLAMCVRRVAERKGLVYNYYNLARTFYEDHVEGSQQVELKKYLYGLRPALALRHMRLFPGVPPMNIQQLMDGADLSERLTAEIQKLLDEKASGREMGCGPRRDPLDALIKLEIDNAGETKPERSQLVSDDKLLQQAERTFHRLIGMDKLAV